MQAGHLNEVKQPFRAFNEQQSSDLLEPFQMSDDQPAGPWLPLKVLDVDGSV